MKKYLTALVFMLSFWGITHAQKKHDYIWTLGYDSIHHTTFGYSFGGVVMDFNSTPPSISLQDYVIDRTKASIADASGHLVAYTDGCRILNRNHQIMANGDTLNPGAVFNEFCGLTSYPLWQPCIFLPKPGSDSLYYLFHIRCDDDSWNPLNLMYSVVDASGDNGNGAVVSKNNVLYRDSIFLNNYVTATRHANGEDWWVVVPRRFSNNMHVSKLSSQGVTYKGMQDLDYLNLPIDSASCCSQTAFSPDGSKYFRNSPESLLMLDFDRCTGTFSHPVRLDWDTVPFGGGGVAVSPNSRYLYLTSGSTVQQYDLWAPDLATSMQVVATYDGAVSPYPTTFFQMMPGPDGKIYIVCTYGNDVLHVIENPDLAGLACNVAQHAVQLPALTAYFIINFANYNLGPLDPPCEILDATEGTAQQLSQPLQIAPNPSSGNITISLPASEGGTLNLYNANGQKVITQQVAAGVSKVDLDLGTAPPGLYWVVFGDKRGRVLGKVVRV